ncbi:MAG: hypothetical protein M3680_33050 [Myxococcota bacterium]|nr:hypothetical protein [Myxococcota bacterium]
MVEVLERGDISFFWRPAVQAADAGLSPAGAARIAARSGSSPLAEPGVQSFFVVLSTGSRHRRLRIGKKRMPATPGERLWARVERVGSLRRVLADQLESERYTTKTRGERFQPGAELIARGAYAFVRHADHTHLAYRLDQSEDAPAEVRVPDAGSHIVLFERVPQGRALWTTDGEPRLLDEEGAECVLVGADDEPEAELGIEVLCEPVAMTRA